jgi:hypothetical protein
MPWQSHGGSSYYYVSQRVDGKTQNSYVGKGAAAALAAIAVETDRMKREERRRSLCKPPEHVIVLELFTSLRELVRQELHAAGYHQHAHGEWRKKRERRSTE